MTVRLGLSVEGASEREFVRRVLAPHLAGREEINDSPQTSPSHRLLQWMPRYRKPLQGPPIIELVGLPIIRAQCPRLDAWVTRLEQLGRGPTA